MATSVALNMRVSPGLHRRLSLLAERYDLNVTSVSRIALVMGLETLEQMRGQLPSDPGPTGPDGE